MTQSLVLTVIGPDRPGLVESLSEAVSRHQGNWLESRMAQLAGQFAGILRIDVPDESAQRLRASLEELAVSGLRVQVAEAGVVAANSSEALADAGGSRYLKLELAGQDRPGIVHDIAAALAANGANVERLETETQPAPMTGDLIFVAEVQISVAENTDSNRLRTALEDVAGHLMVDISLEEYTE